MRRDGTRRSSPTGRGLRVALAASMLLLSACGAVLGFQEISYSQGDGGEPSGSDADTDAVAADADGSRDGDAAAPICDPDASFTDDPHNCGQCGHDCLGGGCTASTCQPLTIAAGQTGTIWLAVDDGSVYWTDGTTIRACPKSGCIDAGAPLTVADGRAAAIRQITIAGSNLYWAECPPDTDDGGVGGVYACPRGGCGSAPNAMATAGGVCFMGVAPDVASNVLYFTNATDSAVQRCALDACSFGAAVAVADKQYAYLSSIVMAPGGPYWLQNAMGLFGCNAPNCAPAGGHLLAGVPDTEHLVAPPSIVGDVAVFQNYTTAASHFTFHLADIPGITPGGGVYRARLDGGGAAAELIVAQGAPTGVVADPSGVRFADYKTGAIGFCPLAGCDGGAQQIALGQGGPFSIVQDDAAIYWGNLVDGRIMKLAK